MFRSLSLVVLVCLTWSARADVTSVSRKIDAIIQSRLDREKIPASPIADDAEFLRRIYLDLAGRIPTLDQTREFLSSKEADKRGKLIDELLSRPEYGVYFATIWRDLIVDRTPEMSRVRQLFSWEFREWLAESLNKDRGWNAIVSDMITVEGDAKANPSATFMLAARMNDYPRPADAVSSVGRLFMGNQIRCAQCHDHPFVDGWKQDDFWGMAAFFGQVRDHAIRPGAMAPNNPTIYETALPDPKTNEAYNKTSARAGVLPPLDGPQIGLPTIEDPGKVLRVVQAKYFLQKTDGLPKTGPYRPRFAEWLTSANNPYFAKTAANRLWAHFFARGIASIDDMRPDQKPSHPELLDLLESEFKKADFKYKHLIRVICNSETYQRTSKPVEKNANDRELFSHMAIKQLSPDQMVDSLNVAIRRTLVVGKSREQYTSMFATAEADADPTEYSHGIPQFLLLMNAGVAKDLKQIARPDSKNKAEAIDTMYLSILSRPARPSEVQRLTAYLDKAADLQQGYQDVYWTLLNCAEFTLNH